MTRPDRALVVGYGSIGARHARLLRKLGLEVAVASRRAIKEPPHFETPEQALDVFQPGYVVVSDETIRHRDTTARLAAAGFDGRVLVEKPLVAEAGPLSDHKFASLAVGYQLRFHPAVRAFRQRLESEEPVLALIEAGQHLSGWRPGRDWRHVYSSSRTAGGGVLRDLSHELDLMLWSFGAWRRLAALGGNMGVLAIESDEAAALLVETERCPAVSLMLDYLSRPARRRIVVETRRHTIVLDLIAGTLTVDGETEQFETDQDVSLTAMHEAVLADKAGTYCTAGEGLAVVELIAAIERAIEQRAWIEAA